MSSPELLIRAYAHPKASFTRHFSAFLTSMDEYRFLSLLPAGPSLGFHTRGFVFILFLFSFFLIFSKDRGRGAMITSIDRYKPYSASHRLPLSLIPFPLSSLLTHPINPSVQKSTYPPNIQPSNFPPPSYQHRTLTLLPIISTRNHSALSPFPSDSFLHYRSHLPSA